MTVIIFTLNSDTFSNPTLQAFFEELDNTDTVKNILLFSTNCNDQKLEQFFKKLNYVHLKDKSPFSIFCFVEILVRLSFNRNISLYLVDPFTIPLIALAKLLRIKVTYFSFEIFFLHEAVKGKFLGKLQKTIIFKVQDLLLSLVDAFVIQDKTRYKLTKLKLSSNKVFLCPVSPSENSIRKKERNVHTIYKVIYSGTISKWSGIDFVFKAIQDVNWPSNVYLYLHSRFETIDSEIKKEIDFLISKGAKIHLDLAPQTSLVAYLEYLSNFDIGLSFYHPTYDSLYNGKNIEFIGLSSGKSNSYLSQGIPFVSTKNNEYKKLNNLNEFCYFINCESSKEVAAGLHYLIDNYENCTRNASKVYSEYLVPNQVIRTLIAYTL